MNFLFSIFNVSYQLMDSFAFLIISAIGLAIIFGMMGIVNLAHGEFIMLGAYITTLLAHSRVPLPLAVVAATVFVAIFGYIVDRLIIRYLYGRPLDSVVATWGISLILGQGMLILMGPSLQGISTPLGSFTLGDGSYSYYRVVLFVCALALLFFMYWLFMHTEFGLRSRATMQNRAVAQSLGTNTSRMYTITFMLGSAFAGLTGGLYAPTMSISPTFGSSFIMPSFVTVIVGGANPLVGTLLSGGALSAVNSVLSMLYGTLIGKLGLLVVAILFIRIFPLGFSGLIEKKLMRGR
ncbi:MULTISPECIES: ABC transporter permease subunit [Paenibacillus]|uniref:ABC transporter permease n=1 Tax=Paenibacillus naphthalenovorans TaxID=162209 RepID=A0A0U2VLZ8_9BACL|nr:MULTISPECIES: branched-chain amino acid ABC transporter permease [Paenibacillus]ALS24323.1 ABC transporter permease [Paenibacillus naphthalenovorans]SDI53896.1 branched-chain amino acid transport system permease protein [Paenibacillus naphthalenovorans]